MISEDAVYSLITAQNKTKKFWAYFLIFLSIEGTVGFMGFIYEESMQTAMFGSFNYVQAKDWDGLKGHIGLMQGIQDVSKFSIYSIGWLNPIMFFPYKEYLKANQADIDSLKVRVREKK